MASGLFQGGRSGSWIDKLFRPAWLFAVRALKIPVTGPKRELLEEAERQVREKGFDTVSVRDVTKGVKANVAAVNYHFGSREGLMDLVMLRILSPLCEERLKLLEKVDYQAAGKILGVAGILSAYVEALPATGILLGMESLSFLRLAGRILVLPAEKLPPQLAGQRDAISASFFEALCRALPATAPGDVAAGWRFFESGLSHALLTLTPADNPTALLAQWTAFATTACGVAEGIQESAAETMEDSSQGMLFDF